MAPTWLDVLDEAAQVCATQRRTDLVRRLQQKRTQLLDPTLRVLVIGEPKQGKSQLINALINAPLCPVGDGPTAAIPTVVHHAEAPTATLVQPAGVREPAEPAESATATVRTPLPVTELTSRLSAGPSRSPEAGPTHAEVGIPRGLLAAGLVLVDAPGTDLPTLAGSSTVMAVARADVVVLVSDATRELSGSELDLLQHVVREHPHVVVALTKTDLVPHWRLVAERNRQHLDSAGVSAPLVPVSATLRLQAAQTNDKAINAESGFPDLIARLMRARKTKGELLAPVTVGQLVGTVIEQLAAPLRASLSEPKGESGPLTRLHEAQRALDELRRCQTRWQNSLGDGMADLVSDIEYDLRDRTRQIMREVDEAFDTADPLRTWEAFQTWLEKALTEAAEANFAWLVQRCDWVAGRVAEHFAPYRADIPPEWRAGGGLRPAALLRREGSTDSGAQIDWTSRSGGWRSLAGGEPAGPPAVLEQPVAAIERPSIEPFTPMQKVFTGLRSSYLGVLMFGLATTLAGMPLLNPISLGAGAVFAGKGIHDQSKSLLKRRQATAKAATQRHVDDFFLRLSKESKDSARWVQHMLRDHYTALTEQINDGIVHSLRTAKQAADADAAKRDQRHRDLQQQLKRLAALHERAQALTTVRGAPTSAAPTSPVPSSAVPTSVVPTSPVPAGTVAARAGLEPGV